MRMRHSEGPLPGAPAPARPSSPACGIALPSITQCVLHNAVGPSLPSVTLMKAIQLLYLMPGPRLSAGDRISRQGSSNAFLTGDIEGRLCQILLDARCSGPPSREDTVGAEGSRASLSSRGTTVTGHPTYSPARGLCEGRHVPCFPSPRHAEQSPISILRSKYPMVDPLEIRKAREKMAE